MRNIFTDCRSDLQAVMDQIELSLAYYDDPTVRVMVNGPATILCVGEEKTVVKVHDEDFDLEKGIAMAILKHCGFKRSTMRKLMEDAEIQDGGKLKWTLR